MRLSIRMYVDKQQLKAEIIQSQLDGRATAALGDMFMAIAQGVMNAYFTKRRNDSDMLSEIVLKLLQAMPKLDPAREPFSYLTMIARNAISLRYRKENRDWLLKQELRKQAERPT